MLNLDFIRQNPAAVEKGAAAKNRQIDTAKILELDEKIKNLKSKIENLRNKRNKAAEDKNIETGKKIKTELGGLEKELAKIEPELNNLLRQIPNLPAKDVKIGEDASENEVIKEWGEKPKFNFPAKDYLTLAEKLDIIDVKRAAKASGRRFGYLKGLAAELQFALINYGLEILKKEGFTIVVPPVLLNEKSMAGMGFLEKANRDEVYHLEKDNLYLAGTSEQSIGAMHQDEILDLAQPLLYAGYSTCFRREAGSYGKDTKGILRVHQFDKMEMFVFCRPEESAQLHEKLLAVEEKIVQGLKIPYRVVKLCSGDLGNASAKTYDLECWLPGQNCYRETHSTSNCTDFQARRLNIRYKNPQTGKNEFCHTLNGTAIAIGRMLIAIIENYQTKDGNIDFSLK
ncbi:MAG: seryl-tRNA synthetase [Candidatus Berkelbacteria bacterium Licking1014_2]|uniref:Serine--tRNA ligase n=1 Tax=Candidatus Berkelbacteria bacterium Licking1014_2 TaxID=2017146 RepID=A0A554LUL2_9BACT|nr:MAG: seryl-tRNA synthetase [Candidatus Berkelbacteria bacterium Licking1014_2]